MNTLKENAAFIKRLKSAVMPFGWKNPDTDIYENLSHNHRTGMAIHEAWVFAPIINSQVKICSQVPLNELNAKTLKKIRLRSFKLLVSRMAGEYSRHHWFGQESLS